MLSDSPVFEQSCHVPTSDLEEAVVVESVFFLFFPFLALELRNEEIPKVYFRFLNGSK